MGGNIEVKSEQGKGTSILFTLPFQKVFETVEQAETADNSSSKAKIDDPIEIAVGTEVSVPTVEEALAQGRLVLVAEDNVVNQDIIRRQLNNLGYQCEIAPDGKDALSMWQKKHYGVVLTDCQMPEMDGYELTLTIRKEEKDKGKKRTPIIAITANALKEEVKVCRAAGMDDYLSKPLAKRDLGLMLKKWLGKEGDTLHQPRDNL